MDKSRIVIIADSVLDGTIGIEQAWQNYGNMIQGTSNVSTEQEANALVGLHLRYGVHLDNNGYYKDAKAMYEKAQNVLSNEKRVMSEQSVQKASEAILYRLAVVNRQMDDYVGAFQQIKELRKMFPHNDEYKQAYIGCVGNIISKYTNPVYIIIAVLFLLKMGEIYLTHTHYIPGWLVDAGLILWICMLIVQFGLPWILKRILK
jgi:tetratricopeptide (TPR) repeat protein